MLPTNPGFAGFSSMALKTTGTIFKRTISGRTIQPEVRPEYLFFPIASKFEHAMDLRPFYNVLLGVRFNQGCCTICGTVSGVSNKTSILQCAGLC